MQPVTVRFARRRILLVAGVVVLLVTSGLLAERLFQGSLQAPYDFAEYWAAGRLNAYGENPYDGARVRHLQRSLGLDDTAIMMWNPPWALTLVMPIGSLSFQTAYGVWVLLNFVLLLASADLLWRGLGGPPGQRWVAYALTLTFVPTVFLIGSGQITGVVLFGLAGFIATARNGRPVLAGAVGAFTALKPHLLALFALWLMLEATRNRFYRKVVLGGGLVGLLACVPPGVANPDVWAQYVTTVTGASSADHHHLSRWAPPLAGWWLRAAIPGQPFWVQWVPLVVAAIVLAVVWCRGAVSPVRYRSPHHQDVTRADSLRRWFPWLVGFSLLAAPYGGWQFDLVLLTVPVFAVVVKLVSRSTPGAMAAGLLWLTVANIGAFAMMLSRAAAEWYVWFTPWVLLGHCTACWLADSPRALAPFSPVTASAAKLLAKLGIG